MAVTTLIASVPRAPSSSVPPAARRTASSPPISRARSTTPSAILRLCDTMTIPTTAEPYALQAVGAVEQLDGMHRPDPGAVFDLPAACLAVTHRCLRLHAPNVLEQVAADLHGNVVLLLLQAVRPSDPTTRALRIDDLQLGDQSEEVDRRLAHLVTSLLARHVIRNLYGNGREIGGELAPLVEVEQELADVVHPFGYDFEVVALHPENLASFPFEHQAAACRRGDDVVSLPRVRRQLGHEPLHVSRGVVEQPVGLQREATAVLSLRDDDVEPVVLEHRDRLGPQIGLEVVRATSVKIDNRAAELRRIVFARPPLKGPARERRHGSPAINANGLLDGCTNGFVAKGPVGDGRDRCR